MLQDLPLEATVAVHRDNAAAAELWLGRLISSGSVRPDTKAFNAALGAFARKGDPAGAIRLFDRMPSYGVVADAATYNIVLHAYSRVENVQGCEEWLAKMRSAGIEPDKASYGCIQQARAKTIAENSPDGNDSLQSGVSEDVTNRSEHSCGRSTLYGNDEGVS